MPKFNVMVNMTRRIEKSVEIEVSAKDADAAELKASDKIAAAQEKMNLDEAFDWEDTDWNDDFDYEVEEA